VDRWDEVRRATAGALAIEVHPKNGGIAGPDPATLHLLSEARRRAPDDLRPRGCGRFPDGARDGLLRPLATRVRGHGLEPARGVGWQAFLKLDLKRVVVVSYARDVEKSHPQHFKDLKKVS
jgi:hypothetical protein